MTMTPSADHGLPPPANGAAHHETVLEVGTERIARVYAEALLRAALKQRQADEILEDLESLADEVLKADPHFEAFMASGTVDRKRKAEVIHAAFDGRGSALLINFLLVLNDHERLEVAQGTSAFWKEGLQVLDRLQERLRLRTGPGGWGLTVKQRPQIRQAPAQALQ